MEESTKEAERKEFDVGTLLLSVLILNVIDVVLTVVLLTRFNKTELNPIFAPLLDANIGLAIIIKFGIILLFIVVMKFMYERTNEAKTKKELITIMKIAALFYLVVVINNVIVFALEVL